MSVSLNPGQIQQSIEVMRDYLSAPFEIEGRLFVDYEEDFDLKRRTLIDSELNPLLSCFLSGQISLVEFKTTTDGINKRNQLWGFTGIKGQMFFNMLTKTADDTAELDRELKLALEAPVTDEEASSRIRGFEGYVKRVGDRYLEAGGSKLSRPKVSSVAFFLSYFWQIQKPDLWPIYYTNSVSVMTDLNLWIPTGEASIDYIEYRLINQELAELFSKESGRRFGLYDVEHVFWFKSGRLIEVTKPRQIPNVPLRNSEKVVVNDQLDETREASDIRRLPESYIPPIVAILPTMARNEPSLREAAKQSGTSLDRAFEKSINAAFSILGYETKLLGQGMGRVPDGLALSVDDSYAILWDAKIRGSGYSMGTDDRSIREYVVTQSRELKRKNNLRNLYYFIVSSSFTDDYDDSIRSLKMDTDVNEVCLVEVEALVTMVDAKLRSPQDVSLGSDGLQRLFSVSGILSARFVRDTFA